MAKERQGRQKKGGRQTTEHGDGGGTRPAAWVCVPKRLMAFLGILLLECALAAALLTGFAYLAFRIRLSAEVIRMGLAALYAIPCLLGGRVARRLRPALLWAVSVSAAFYGVLLALSAQLPQTGAEPGIGIPLLCAASGAAGALLGGKKPKGA